MITPKSVSPARLDVDGRSRFVGDKSGLLLPDHQLPAARGRELDFEPPPFTVALLDGTKAEVMPIFEMYKRHLADYDLETVQEISGAAPEQVCRLTEDIWETTKPASRSQSTSAKGSTTTSTRRCTTGPAICRSSSQNITLKPNRLWGERSMAAQVATPQDDAELLNAYTVVEEHDIGAGVHERYLALADELASRLGVRRRVFAGAESTG